MKFDTTTFHIAKMKPKRKTYLHQNNREKNNFFYSHDRSWKLIVVPCKFMSALVVIRMCVIGTNFNATDMIPFHHCLACFSCGFFFFTIQVAFIIAVSLLLSIFSGHSTKFLLSHHIKKKSSFRRKKTQLLQCSSSCVRNFI